MAHPEVDVVLRGRATVIQFHLLTERAHSWFDQHNPPFITARSPEGRLLVDRGYAYRLSRRLRRDGLKVVEESSRATVRDAFGAEIRPGARVVYVATGWHPTLNAGTVVTTWPLRVRRTDGGRVVKLQEPRRVVVMPGDADRGVR